MCNQWIAVSERLPERLGDNPDYSGDLTVYDEGVLSAWENNGSLRGFYSFKVKLWYAYNGVDVAQCSKVTHWQPLPEPPKGA